MSKKISDKICERPSWHEYFMNMVELVSTRSTCTRKKVGAVIVKDNRVLTTGYNGKPTKTSPCTEENCIRTIQNIPSGERLDLCPAIHAEQNAIIQAALLGVSIKGSVMYTNKLPCSQCTKLILNSGISCLIVEPGEWRDDLAVSLFKERNDVKIWQYQKGKRLEKFIL
jgi:dCMP deaminase